jgi:hypothetical protein
MAITSTDFESISERDLVQLLDDQVAEGLNTAGSHFVLGMNEIGGLPTELIGLNFDADAEMQRLENLFRTSLEPRIVGLRMRAVPLGNGRRALVIRLPKSWNPPHARFFKGSRRYFARNSSGAHDASVEELRAMFTLSVAVFDRVQEFHRRRQGIVHMGKTPIPLIKEPQFVPT